MRRASPRQMNSQAAISGKILEPRIDSSAARGVGRMMAFALIAVLLLMGVAAWGLRQAVFVRGVEDAQRAARIVEEHAEKVIGGHLAELEQIEWQVRDALGVDAASGRVLHDRLKAVAEAHREVESIWLVDRRGDTWATSVAFPPPAISHRERGYFLSAERGEERPIGRVIFGRVTQNYVFQIANRLSDEAGRFLGVAFASLDPGYFRAFYRSLGPAEDSVMLLREDGALLVRSPQPQSDPTSSMAGAEFMSRFSTQSGTFRARGAFDEHEFIYSYRRLEGLPIYAVYGVQVRRMTGEWIERVLSYLLFAGPALLTLGLVAHVVLRQSREIDRGSRGLREANLLLEQRVAERTKDLRESETRLRMGAEIGRFGTYEWSIEKDEHVWSLETYAIFGLPPTTAVSARMVLGMVHPEDRPRFDAAIAADLRRSEPGVSSLEYRIVRPDGQVRWVHASARTKVFGSGEERKVEQVAGVIQDVTDRKQTELALAHSEERLRLAQNAGGIGCWDFDVTTDVVHWSEGFYRLWGLDPAIRPTKELFFSLIHPDDRARTRADVERVLQKGDRLHLEFRFAFPDGRVRWAESQGDITRDDEGKAVRIVGIHRDITERRRTEERLRVVQAELQHVWRVTDMGQMATTLAHELNQPLASIANYVGGALLLLTGLKDGAQLEKIREVMALARDEAVRAGRIIRRLREFIGRGDSERRVEPVGRLVEDALALALTGVQERGVNPRVVIESTDDVLVDRVQIQQVLVNLVRNAVEAMETSARKELEVRVACVERMVRFSVSDTGTGLAPEIAGRLFEPFSSTKKQGMGIGLSVSHGIVEDHGGRIWAEPNPGGGTVFCFTIPALHRESSHARVG